jgi:hypothetical protein
MMMVVMEQAVFKGPDDNMYNGLHLADEESPATPFHWLSAPHEISKFSVHCSHWKVLCL